jgi:hypothetical protein
MESKEGQQLIPFANTSYETADIDTPMKTFVQERFASLLLVTGKYNVVYVDSSQTAPIFIPMFGAELETRKLLQLCELMKRKFRETQEATYLKKYWETRATIPYHPPPKRL